MCGIRRRRAARANARAFEEGVDEGVRMRFGMCSRRVISARPASLPSQYGTPLKQRSYVPL